MKIAIDLDAITNGDLDFSVFNKFGETVCYDNVTKQELYALCADCDAIIINKTEIDVAFLDACPKMKYVGTFSTGYNCIDVKACRERGITVCNVPDYSTNAVAQHVFAMLLSFCGKISEYSRSVADGEWLKSKSFCYYPFRTLEVAGRTFGVYGFGHIGKKVAKIAETFGMRVLICTRTRPSECPYEVVSLETLLKESDFLSLNCALNEQTRGMINERTLSLMKPTAVLINTARGALIDEKALADALNGGRIAGACLDVVAEEPMRENCPLYGAKNTVITPHIAWTSKETRERLVRYAAENLEAFINGKPKNVVN